MKITRLRFIICIIFLVLFITIFNTRKIILNSVYTNYTKELKLLEDKPWNLNINNGYYHPPSKKPTNSFAIIIPFRDRLSHLVQFLEIMHPYLQKQNAEYQIFIVEQNNNNIFNKGALMNAGFDYISRLPNNTFNCYIFHDVDVLPLVPNIIYRCSTNPFHIGSYIDTFNFKIVWSIVGGVFAVTKDQYKQLNGFSNLFQGWGGEDDDMYRRVLKIYKTVERPPKNHRFYLIKHDRDEMNPVIALKKRMKLLGDTLKRFKEDGLNTIKYSTPKFIKDFNLVTWIQFDFPQEQYFVKETNKRLKRV